MREPCAPGSCTTFTWADYLTHVGARKKSVPAFDAFDLSAGENNEFGSATTANRATGSAPGTGIRLGANDTDPGDFITWIAEVMAYKKSRKPKQTK
jgi:hypothetical protein